MLHNCIAFIRDFGSPQAIYIYIYACGLNLVANWNNFIHTRHRKMFSAVGSGDSPHEKKKTPSKDPRTTNAQIIYYFVHRTGRKKVERNTLKNRKEQRNDYNNKSNEEKKKIIADQQKGNSAKHA